jgi:hypothetical protein
MKTSSGLESPDASGQQRAKGYLATNLVMPGLGSLAGGHKVGLWQLGLYLSGFAITLVFGLRFMLWALAHWSEFHTLDPRMDPLQPLRDLFLQARWPVLGIVLAAVSWCWSMQTSRKLLAEEKAKGAGTGDGPA